MTKTESHFYVKMNTAPRSEGTDTQMTGKKTDKNLEFRIRYTSPITIPPMWTVLPVYPCTARTTASYFLHFTC